MVPGICGLIRFLIDCPVWGDEPVAHIATDNTQTAANAGLVHNARAGCVYIMPVGVRDTSLRSPLCRTACVSILDLFLLGVKPITQQIAGAGAVPRHPVFRIVQCAFLQRQTATSNTAIQILAQPGEGIDAPVQFAPKPAADAPPITQCRRSLQRERFQLRFYLVEREAKLLCD